MLPTKRAELYVPTASVDDIYTFLHEKTTLVKRYQLFLCIVRRPEAVDPISPQQPFHAVTTREEWWFGVVNHKQFVTKQNHIRTPMIILQAGTHVHKRTHPNADGEHIEIVDDGPILIRFNEGSGYFDPYMPVPDAYVPLDYKLNNETYEPFVLVIGDSIKHYVLEHTLLQESYFTARRMLGFKQPNDMELRVKEDSYIDDLVLDLYLAWREFEDVMNSTKWFPDRPKNQRYLTFEQIRESCELSGGRHLQDSTRTLLRRIAEQIERLNELEVASEHRMIDNPYAPGGKLDVTQLLTELSRLLRTTNIDP
jgi:hypothetical protein